MAVVVDVDVITLDLPDEPIDQVDLPLDLEVGLFVSLVGAVDGGIGESFRGGVGGGIGGIGGIGGGGGGGGGEGRQPHFVIQDLRDGHPWGFIERSEGQGRS